MIEELKKYEDGHLDDWLDLSDKDQERFMRKWVAYADGNPNEVTTYCHGLNPQKNSSLGIIYEAFSLYSYRWNSFLLSEIKRWVQMAVQKQIKPKHLNVLHDIDLEDIYEKDYAIYTEIIDFLISQLSPLNSEKLNKTILDLLDDYMIELDGEEEEMVEWKLKLQQFGHSNSSAIQDKIEDILTLNDTSSAPKRGSKKETLASIFFVLALFAIYGSIKIFRVTLIEQYIPLGFSLLMGILGYVLFSKRIKIPMPLIYKILYNWVIFGGFSVYALFLINQKLPPTHKDVTVEQCPILETYFMSKNKPVVLVHIQGFDKELIYSSAKSQEAEIAQLVEVETQNGFLGFPVILRQTLQVKEPQ